MMPRVLDIQRRHMELGRIRMGEKGSKGQPQRLETWRLTSASEPLLQSAAGVYGGTVEEWTDAPDKGYYQLTTETAALDVMIPPGDAYSQYYELWSGGGCKRRCDGETELLTGLACKCDPEARECKITTRISVMLPQVAGLGVWRLESHGYYAAAELPDMLELLQQVSGGRIIGGVLRIEQRSSKKDGKTNRYPVPVLDLPNITLASLTGGGVVVNPPHLDPGKPPLLTGATMPEQASFDNGAPNLGPAPALPSNQPPDSGVREESAGDRTRPKSGEAAGGDSTPSPVASHDYRRGELAKLMIVNALGMPQLEEYATLLGIPRGQRATDEQMDRLIAAVEGHGTDAPLDLGLEPPSPGTDAYKALPTQAKAEARAYWSKQEASA